MNCGFRDTQADRQTNKHTDTLITILRTPTRDEVKAISMKYKPYQKTR